jgi:hypothetical protein
MSKETSNAMDDFEAEILENEVVIAHVGERHAFYFPILTNGAVSLHGSLIEAKPRRKADSAAIPASMHTTRSAWTIAGYTLTVRLVPCQSRARLRSVGKVPR